MSTIGMTNVQDTEPGPLLTEQDFEHLTRKPWQVPAPIQTRRTLWQRIVRFGRIAVIDYEINSLEDWIRDCARDGILDSNQLTGCRYRLQELRCERAAVEAA